MTGYEAIRFGGLPTKLALVERISFGLYRQGLVGTLPEGQAFWLQFAEHSPLTRLECQRPRVHTEIATLAQHYCETSLRNEVESGHPNPAHLCWHFPSTTAL